MNPLNIKVLLIDGNLMERLALCMMLKGCGCEVTEADNCHEALELLKESPRQCDLVICDAEAPLLEDVEFLKNIKKHYDGPVILLTDDEFLQSHVNGFIVKLRSEMTTHNLDVLLQELS